MISQKNSRCHTSLILVVALAAASLCGGSAALAESEPLPPVPDRFIDYGPGEFLGININAYCRVKHANGSQHLGHSKWWNAWACKVPQPGKDALVGIDMIDVCRTQHPGSKPVNNTGSAYNWYCKK
jgi:hypothetical protein